MDGVCDRRPVERTVKQSSHDAAMNERERLLDAAIKALNEFDEKYGSFADEYAKDIL